MFLYIFPIGMIVISNVVYHLLLKVTPGSANPPLTLFITYITSAICCLALMPFFPITSTLSHSLRQLNWTSWVLGIIIVGLEMGYLLAYRAGWEISLAGIVASTCVGLLLIPIGLSVFHEKLSPINMIGILVCIAGLIMINRK